MVQQVHELMAFNTSKPGIILAAILLALIVLYLIGKKSVHHEIIINAPVKTVWSVLTDTEAYPEWNPVMAIKQGLLSVGQSIDYTFTEKEGKSYDIRSEVKEIRDGELLNQGGGIPIILSFDHRYILKPAGEATRLTIHEDYRGIGVPFWNPDPVEKAYARLNQAIKSRSESIN